MMTFSSIYVRIKSENILFRQGGNDMAGKRQLALRNQRMDLYKGIAIYCVISIHVLFPGSFGSGIRALARFAVPFFFLTAGYFNFNASTRSLGRRAARTLKQLILSSLPYLLLGCILAAKAGTSVSEWLKDFWDIRYLEEFFQFHTVPFPYAWQLWFLGALLAVYLLWWAFHTLAHAAGRPFPYDAAAIIAAALLLLHLVLGEGFGLLGRETDNRLLRNALLDGLPFFALGSWAAWRRRDIKAANIPWHYLILGGAALSLLEAKLAGKQEMYLGTLILLVGLMGRCIRYRRAPGGKLSQALQFCGQELTLPIFIVHMLVLAAIREIPALAWLNDLSWILPPVVAALSTLIALGLVWAKANLSRKKVSA